MESDDRVVVERRKVVIPRKRQLEPYDDAKPKPKGAANQPYDNVDYSNVHMISIIKPVNH